MISANASIKIAILKPKVITPIRKEIPIIITAITIPNISILLNIDSNFFNKNYHLVSRILTHMIPQTY